jgi:hypothetical protein
MIGRDPTARRGACFEIAGHQSVKSFNSIGRLPHSKIPSNPSAKAAIVHTDVSHQLVHDNFGRMNIFLDDKAIRLSTI